jgi:hypothetical protein
MHCNACIEGGESWLQRQIELDDIDVWNQMIPDTAQGSGNRFWSPDSHICNSGYTGCNSWKLQLNNSMNNQERECNAILQGNFDFNMLGLWVQYTNSIWSRKFWFCWCFENEFLLFLHYFSTWLHQIGSSNLRGTCQPGTQGEHFLNGGRRLNKGYSVRKVRNMWQ